MTLIDLDQPPPVPATDRREPRRWRRIAASAALMLVAAGLGGFATDRWQQQRSRSTVQVAVLADLSLLPPMRYEIGAQTSRVAAVLHLTVVNTGPVPVRLAAISVAAFGMGTDDWMPVDKLIAPGQGTISTNYGGIDCEDTALAGTAPATAEVVTTDGDHRRRIAVDLGEWRDQVAQTCTKV
ncbi:hypothetical protein [Actinoplanes palleronii]|uniref:DUF4352 domain-containing protein n=1 Tax=Actinoplanes palleronii TaxID=113570 RepID=A0ABQ4BA36_9ACTN|nr:hypothetical protein [Actinoplanes palleronii]GIE67452.1 hypothetical protein Apa02nite_035600 [Actinoplanes palleronii]